MMSNFSGFGTSKFEVFRVLAASRRVEGCSTIIWQVVSGSIDCFHKEQLICSLWKC